MPPSRGGASAASEHGVAACHLCGELEREAHGLPFTDWLGSAFFSEEGAKIKVKESNGYYHRDYPDV